MTDIDVSKLKKRKKLNSRWSRTDTRYSASRRVERVRSVRNRDGVPRIELDQPTEPAYVDGFRERFGWRNGARIRAV